MGLTGFQWAGVLIGLAITGLAVMVLLLVRRLGKVEDLAARLHEDLTIAESRIEKLRDAHSRTTALLHQRALARVTAEPVWATQPSGRHARPE